MTILLKNASAIMPEGIKKFDVLIRGEIIEKISESISASADETIDLKGDYLSPAFIDGHIHGFGGKGTDIESADSLIGMSEYLAEKGVGSFCPTLYSAKPEKLLKDLKLFAKAKGKEKGAKIIGLHLEGPFISPKKLGAMKAEDLAQISRPLLEQIWDAAEGTISAMTVAPELDNLEVMTDFAKEKGILLQAGHTDATYQQMMRGFSLGIRHVTHLFNAMSPFNHREPGAAGSAMMEDFSVEIIGDGAHVHPKVVGFIGRIKKPGQIVLITDALTPTKQASGRLLANGEEVEFKDGFFRKKENGIISGSALTMLDGVKNLVSYGFSLELAVMAASANPARLHKLHDRGLIKEGLTADLTAFDKDFNLTLSIINGRIF
ncbi:N-acetylglucosamine-6-phosphate deacetylase [Parelusimicrobium proximum]|uniref:N-acetylglucosamine-6-phosphate deacetylase n=1 Tax=Parelusimicrobium proximum TaxID=3228953 RepID=UPI003D172488